MNARELYAAELLWDYMQLHEPVQDADCLLVIGSLRDDVAKYAAELVTRHKYTCIVLSGGNSRSAKTEALGWGSDTEAEHMLAVMQTAGCDISNIFLENTAENTGQNASKTAEILRYRDILPKTVLVITKPYMERRAIATFDVQWPDPQPEFHASSPQMTFDEYCPSHEDKVYTLNIMVGDLQRIMKYPKLGYQSKQQVPASVLAAFDLLVQAGYTKHLVKI